MPAHHTLPWNTPLSLSLSFLCVLCLCRAEYDCFQIDLPKNYSMQEWKDDVKSILLKSRLECDQMVFLFSDTQVGGHGAPQGVL